MNNSSGSRQAETSVPVDKDSNQRELLPAEPMERIASVDALRGLVILLMIFVNDVAGVKTAPSWLKHVSAQADGMTLPDVVFPAFLFIMGMSVPLALGRGIARGLSRKRLLFRVLIRTLTLLVMGVLMVNMEQHNPGYRGLWGLLTYPAIFIAFLTVPLGPERKRKIFKIVRLVGFIALAVLALAYRTADGKHLILGPIFNQSDTIWLRHSWWGILGLIGWAYLVTALIYLVLGQRREWLIGAAGLLAMLYVADHQGLFSRVDSRAWLEWAAPAIRQIERLVEVVGGHVSIGESLGSLASISMAGCCLGTILLPNSGIRKHSERLRWSITFGIGLAFAALLFDPLFGINKIRATPAWCFLCASLTTLMWAALYWIMDVRKYHSWSLIVRPAGMNPLTAYILHPWIYIIASFLHLPIWFYKSSELPVIVAIFGCLIMAFAMVGLTGLISRLSCRMRA
jgi:heparan-alpha-glucosaminide N-acetyltransferase